jgi:hypothetical protein
MVYNNGNSNDNRCSQLLNYPNYENQNITLLNYMSTKKHKNQINRK